MTDGATATSSGSGHQVSAAAPAWTPLHEPTYKQLREPGVLEVAAHRIHGDVIPRGVVYPIPGGSIYVKSGWHWWIKVDRRTSWMHRYSPVAAASKFDPDEGRRIVREAKDDTARPGTWERVFMHLQGKAALHAFFRSLEATNAERAAYTANVAPLAVAVEYGDLPAAIQLALTAGLPNLLRDRLVHLLEEGMIYWPDFQRKESTTKKSTIAPHLPFKAPTNSGTSLTISGTNPSNSGTSLTISASVTGNWEGAMG